MRTTSVVANAIILLAGSGFVSAMPAPWSVPQEHFDVLSLRHATPLNTDSVTDVHCWDTQAHIVFHDQNAAQLAICDDFSGTDNTRCETKSATTIGKRGSAKFTLTAGHGGSNISISKVRWEECVRAARDKCLTGSLSGICLGDAHGGDVVFTLESTMYALE